MAALIGTASPSPTPATAVLIPTTLAELSTSAPPEFPGLSAASVWITLSMWRTVRPARAGQRAAERRHDAGGDRAGEPVRVADRHHQLADAQLLGLASVGRDEAVAVGPEHGEVRQAVDADDAEAELASVDERRPARVRPGPGDHVGRGEQEAVRRERHGAARAGRHLPAARAARDPQVGDDGASRSATSTTTRE